MITATATESPVNYLNHQSTVASWLLTKDHKRIGLMYMVVVTIAFIIGAFFAAMIRAELATPAGDLLSADVYNRVFTMHGVAMVFFVLIPAVPAILGNFVLPLMLRAIALAKRKNDRIDAAKIADCLRCDFLPECHMASTGIRDRRRILRYRNLVVRQSVQMKSLALRAIAI